MDSLIDDPGTRLSVCAHSCCSLARSSACAFVCFSGRCMAVGPPGLPRSRLYS